MGGGEIAAINRTTLEVTMLGASTAWGTAVGELALPEDAGALVAAGGALPLSPPEGAGALVASGAAAESGAAAGAEVAVLELPQATATTMIKPIIANRTTGSLGNFVFLISPFLLAYVLVPTHRVDALGQFFVDRFNPTSALGCRQFKTPSTLKFPRQNITARRHEIS